MMVKMPLSISLAIASVVVVLFFSSSNSGVTGKSTSGCGGGNCHQPDTATNMTITGLPPNGYVQGQTYALQLMVSNLQKQGAGFNMTVNGGSLTASVGSQVNGLQELYHTSTKAMVAGTATWSFNWIAPSTGFSPVVFFIAGNAVNMNNNPQIDAFDTDQVSVSAAVTSAVPTINSVNVSGITPNNATINAVVNANNSTTSCSIEYGTTVAYGNTAAMAPSSFGGVANTAVSASLTGLLPSTNYHYRLKASNANGTVYSNDAVFITYPSSVEEASINKAHFFPNPCTDFLTYVAKNPNSMVQLNVMNALGQVQHLPIIYLGQGRYQVQTAHLTPGVYSLKAQSAQQNEFALFLKQ